MRELLPTRDRQSCQNRLAKAALRIYNCLDAVEYQAAHFLVSIVSVLAFSVVAKVGCMLLRGGRLWETRARTLRRLGRRPIRIRRIAVLAVTTGVVLSGAAGMAAARSVYYSASGDVYMSVTRMHGVRWILLRTFSLRGQVRVCIAHRQFTDCRSFPLNRLRPFRSGIYQVKRRWRFYFPYRGRGLYFVRITQQPGGRGRRFQIGPRLDFRA